MTNKIIIFLSVLILTSISLFTEAQTVFISQYIETNSGTTPKGIEIFNPTNNDIVFSSSNNLQIYQGTNGGSCSALPGTNTTSGTLKAGEVWVIGTSDLTTYANNNGTDISGTTTFGFSFNGDDALQLYLGGVLQDVIGTCGTDPGSAWTGGGVSTANNNIQTKDGICEGTTSNWTDPSLRFETVANGSTMTGFGNAPSSCSGPANYPDWCNLQWPANGTITEGGSFDVYAQIYELGVTDAAGQGSGIQAWIGYSTSNSDPSTWTNWVAATYNGDSGDNDEYVADIGTDIGSAGTYYYASRFTVNGNDYSYGGYNSGGGGFWSGTNVSGVLTINACPTLSAPVATAGSDIDATSFKANWDAVTGADGYYLDVYSSGGTPITETFTAIDGGTSSSYLTRTWTGDGSIGWTAYKSRTDQVVTSGNEAICLRDESGAYLISDEISGNISQISFDVIQAFSGSGGVLTVKVLSGIGFSTETTIGTISYSATADTFDETFSSISGPYKIRIDNNTSARPVIDNLSYGSGTSYELQNEDVGNVTSYDVTGLTTGTTYYYVVRAYNNCGSTSDDSNEIEVTPQATPEYADWCNLQSPASGTIFDDDSFNVYAQVYKAGITDGAGQGGGVTAWIGYSTSNTDPSTWTNWVAATYNTDVGNNDEYIADIGSDISTPGTYYYASRFSVDGFNYSYGGYSIGGGNFWDGSSYISGILTILPCGTNHTITIDGDLSDWNDCESFTDVSDANNAYFTWDNDYIYLAFDGQEAGEDKQATFVYIDTDPNDFGALNGTTNAYTWGENIEVPFYADYVVVCENDLSGDYTEVMQWNGSAWQSISLFPGDIDFSTTYSASPSAGTKEIRIKRATLGSPSNISIASITEEQFDDNYRNVAWPSEGWTDANRTNSQKLCHYYGYELTSGTEPNNSGAYDKYCRVPCAPENLSLDASSCEIDVNFNQSDCTPTGYITLIYTDPSFSGGPQDGTNYNVNDVITDGSFTATVTNIGTQINFTETGVNGNTTYYFDVYAYNSGSCSGWPVYSDVLSGNVTTPEGADAGEIFISEVAGKGYNGNWEDEYIEISNPGASSVDLTGFVIKYYEGSTLEGSETLSGNLAADDAYVIAIRTTNIAITPDLTFSPQISINSNFYVVLEDECGNIIDQAGNSVDLFDDDNNYEFTNCGGNNLPVANWVNLGSNNGTPGTVDCVVTNAQDGDGIASVYNGSSNALSGYDIWQRDLENQIIIIDVSGESSDFLANISIEIPSDYTGISSENIIASGDAVVSGTIVGLTGNTINISGLELSSSNTLSVEVSGLSTPANNTITDLGLDTLNIKTSIQGGTLTEISSQPLLYSTIPFANIKDYDNITWTLNNINQTVAVEGITTVASGRLTNGTTYDQFFIQEGEGVNGTGLCIRQGELFSPSVDLAKYCVVKGDIKLIRGSDDSLTEVRANMTALSEPTELIIIKDSLLPYPYITTIEELHAMTAEEFEEVDGILMRLEDATKSSGTWPPDNSSFANIDIKDDSGTNTLRCYIFANTDIGGNPEPEWPVNMVTLVYNYDQDGDDFYDGVAERQITPIYYDNFYDNIVWDGSTGNSLWSDAQNWSPNILPQKIDDVVFDNITGPAESYTVTLDTRHEAFVKSVTIIPDAGKEITLIIPESNSNAPALELNAEGNGITIHDGGIFINNSGASSGNPVMWQSSGGFYPDFTILNGGKYVHNTLRSTANMTERLLATSGTENGTFEIDLNSASANFQISASGKTFGNLVLSGTYGNKNYAITGPSPVEIKGDFIVNSGVSINEVWSGTSKFESVFATEGDFIFNGDNWTINPDNESNNFYFGGHSPQIIDIQSTAFNSGFPKDIIVDNFASLTMESDLVISETLTLTSGTLILNTNELKVSGDIISNIIGSITGDNSASIIFEGSGNESLDFTPGAAQLGTLSLNRSGATITLFQDLTIASELIMQNGYINNNTYTLVLGQSATLSGGSYNSFVDGKVSKSGNSVFTFPTGDIRQRDLDDDEVNEEYYVYGPITLTPLASNTISAEYNFTEPPYDWWLHGGNMSPSLIYVSSREYWNVSTTENLGQVSLGWDNNSHAEGELCIHDICPNNQPNNFSFADLSVAVYHNGMWNDLGQSANFGNHDQGYITSNLNFPAIGTKETDYVVTLGSKNPEVTLPIELLSFTGTFKNNEVVLKWSTLSETNNDYFSIEHSTNGLNFIEIGTVLGHGNSIIQQNYSFIHKEINKPFNYYRLKQIDYDGTSSYSKIIAIETDRTINDNLRIQLSQDDYLFVWGINNEIDNYYYIADILGRKLLTGSINSYNDKDYHSVNISELSSGTYIIVFYNRMQKESFKFILP